MHRIIFTYLFLGIILQTFAQDYPVSKVKVLSEATSVKNSPDGRVAIGTSSGDIFLGSPQSSQFDTKLLGQKGAVYQLSFSPDGNFLISCGKEGEVHIWDVRKGIEKYKLEGHKETVVSATINYDGSLAATGDASGKIIVWDVKSGKQVHTFTDHNKSIGELEFAHRSNLLACSDLQGIIEVYNVDSRDILRKMTTQSKKIETISWSPNDQFLASGGDNKVIKLWDVNLGYSTMSLPGHKKELRHVTFSPDGKYLFSIANDNMLKVWDLKEGAEHSSIKGFYKILDCHSSYNGKHLCIADYETTLKVYDITSLGIKEDNDLNQFKNMFAGGELISDPPKINMVHPNVGIGEKFIAKEELFDVKGQVIAQAGLFLLLVNGKETSVDENGFFKARVELAYADNPVSIKAIDVNKQVTEHQFFLTRPYYENLVNADDLKRRGKDYALLIGTDEYEAMSQLSNPVNDTKTIASELKDRFGFETETLLNPTLNQVYEKIREYSAREYSEEDQLFIFIAGHGLFDEVFKQGYLVCKDSKKDDVGKSSYISHANLRTLINNIDCKHINLMLDACFGGTFDPAIASRGEQADEVDRQEFILRKMKYKSRLYVTSGGKEYVPDGRPGQHSPFARHLLEALRSNGGEDRILTINELKSFVEKVTPEPRFGQFGDNEPGSDFLFIAK